MHTQDRSTPLTRMNPLAAALAMALTMAACGGESAPSDDVQGGPTSAPHLRGEILVSAAASLTDAFAEMAAAFEAANPDVDVVLNLGGSSSLRAQILEGAPVDVFAPADTADMARVVDGGRVSGEPRPFARTALQIAVPAGNPGDVRGLADFGDPRLRLGLCAEAVPCGDLARRSLGRANVLPSLDTNEPNVRALLTKIELGELDAGITYRTDVTSSDGAVEGIDIPAEQNVVVEYPIAVLTDAPNPILAGAFVGFVLSPAGQSILARLGFALP